MDCSERILTAFGRVGKGCEGKPLDIPVEGLLAVRGLTLVVFGDAYLRRNEEVEDGVCTNH